MSRPSLSWYARRLRRMSPAELAWRTGDQLRRVRWRTRQVRPGAGAGTPPRLAPVRRFAAVLPAAAAVPADAHQAIVQTADGIMAGRFELLGVPRTDLQAPDWFRDPVTGTRSDPAAYAFRINHRSEA
ncbi:MAG: hypothetical protein GEV00_21830, partial [Actinophytocola sp.]|nr:hypothetical protein [Actinophytocola sp.]